MILNVKMMLTLDLKLVTKEVAKITNLKETIEVAEKEVTIELEVVELKTEVATEMTSKETSLIKTMSTLLKIR